MHSVRYKPPNQPVVILTSLLLLLSSSNWNASGRGGVLAQDDCVCSAPGQDNGVSNSNNNILIGRSSCDPNNTTYCELHCGGARHGSTSSSSYLQDKCCIHAGKSASLLAFEEDSKWIPRLEEFNLCTGANVRLEYLQEGENGMADALVRDVGTDHSREGEGIFDAYIVQAPWYVRYTTVARGRVRFEFNSY